MSAANCWLSKLMKKKSHANKQMCISKLEDLVKRKELNVDSEVIARVAKKCGYDTMKSLWELERLCFERSKSIVKSNDVDRVERIHSDKEKVTAINEKERSQVLPSKSICNYVNTIAEKKDSEILIEKSIEKSKLNNDNKVTVDEKKESQEMINKSNDNSKSDNNDDNLVPKQKYSEISTDRSNSNISDNNDENKETLTDVRKNKNNLDNKDWDTADGKQKCQVNDRSNNEVNIIIENSEDEDESDNSIDEFNNEINTVVEIHRVDEPTSEDSTSETDENDYENEDKKEVVHTEEMIEHPMNGNKEEDNSACYGPCNDFSQQYQYSEIHLGVARTSENDDTSSTSSEGSMVDLSEYDTCDAVDLEGTNSAKESLTNSLNAQVLSFCNYVKTSLVVKKRSHTFEKHQGYNVARYYNIAESNAYMQTKVENEPLNFDESHFFENHKKDNRRSR